MAIIASLMLLSDASSQGRVFVRSTNVPPRRPIVVEAEGLRLVNGKTGRYEAVVTKGTQRDPIWSPSGDQIAFSVKYENAQEIGVVARDGSGLHRATHNRRFDTALSWSPNGARITLERYNARNADVHPKLFVVEADGSGEHRLTPKGFDARCPGWSPKGKLIVMDSIKGHDIYTIRPDGSHLKRVTSGRSSDSAPLWSPSGNRVLFQRTIPRTNAPDDTDLFMVRPDGSGLRRLTNDDVFESEYSWSPDGQKIAYGGFSQQEPRSLWVVGADGSHQRELAKDTHSDTRPTWSRDSRRIIYHREDAHGFNIWSVRANGSRNHRLRATKPNDYYPNWYSAPSVC